MQSGPPIVKKRQHVLRRYCQLIRAIDAYSYRSTSACLDVAPVFFGEFSALPDVVPSFLSSLFGAGSAQDGAVEDMFLDAAHRSAIVRPIKSARMSHGWFMRALRLLVLVKGMKKGPAICRAL